MRIPGADLRDTYTDRFPKRAPKVQAYRRVGGSGGGLPQEFVFGFLLLKSPFLGFRVIRTGYWPDFNVESVVIIKNILL